MEDAKKRELQAAEEMVIEKCHSPKKIIETSANIFSKIEQIEKSKDTRPESSKTLKDVCFLEPCFFKMQDIV